MGRLRRLNHFFVKVAVGILLTGLVLPAILALLPPAARTPVAFWITLVVCVAAVVGLWSAAERSVQRRGAKAGEPSAPPEG